MSKLSPLFILRNHILDFWRSDKKNFLGRTLTIIDASIADPEQRKGIKDLIKDTFYSPDNHLEEEMRTILLEFANKVCSDQTPKTKEEENSFKGKMTFAGQDEVAEPKTEYFN